MDVYVSNTEFKKIGLIDTAASTIWVERYRKPGDFEIYTPATTHMIDLLRKDYYLTRDGTDAAMIVKDIEIITDVESGNYLLVSGSSLESILSRRIVWSQTTLSGKVEACIRRLITENIISPTISERKIPNFELGPLMGFTETMEMQVTGKDLGEVISGICATYGMGYKIIIKDGKLVFNLYKGADRSYNQNSNPYVVFSPEFENLLTSDYKYTKSEYKNVVLVAGEGEGLNRKTFAVGNASGLERYEMYSDARNTSTNDGEISDDLYYKQLEEDGKEILKENDIREAYSGGVNYQNPYSYGSDYFMGDLVQVVNEYGIGASPRITETIESEDENGYSLIPTFEYNGGNE